MRARRTPFVFLLVCGVLSAGLRSGGAMEADFSAVVEVIEDRCMTCHDAETRKGGIDLTPLLHRTNASYGNYTKLWVRLENMVARGEMPPENKKSLEPSQKQAIQDWFHQSFVLREGKSHIGASPLRRLTRYEFENTLEEVLSIRLKAPYRDIITGRIETSKIDSLVPSDIPGESGFDNDARRLGRLKPPLRELADAVNHALGKFRKDPVAMKAVLGRADISESVGGIEIRKIISDFILRAYRGNGRRLPEYVAAYDRLYQKHLRSSKDVAASLFHVLEMILVSPEFLYRIESSQGRSAPYPVTGVELASRLSYFLWSRPPDEELLKLGRDGSLHRDAVLKSQVARMLNSPKRVSLSENFAGQWLGFNELLSNREYLRDERWNRASYDEILFFFDEMIRSNRSVLELVQSDWLYKRASAYRAKGKGYKKVEGSSMNRLYVDIFSDRESRSGNRKLRYSPPVMVERKDDREGGIITSAAIMRLTASKTRTSPIRRGVWILNTLIGKSMEAPEDVPSLDEAREALKVRRNPSVSELIKQHVSRAVCHSCHKEIDPLGLGLENFAQFGEWRTQYPDKLPVIASGVMPNGKPFKSPREMKELLLELYKDDIARNFAKQLFAYTLGRKLEPYDRVSLDQIVNGSKESGYRTNTFIEEIILSEQFRYRQDP